MSVFKSWLVANVEVVFIIFTALFLAGVGLYTWNHYNATGDDVYINMAIYIVIPTVILSILLVSLIKSGIGGFIGLLILCSPAVASLYLNPSSESGEDQQLQHEQIDSTPAHEPDSTTLMLDEMLERVSWSWLIWAAVFSFAFGLVGAIYANRNFDEVVSRRFLYRNSALSVFEVQWKYTFNRFYACFMATMAIALELMLFFALRQ